MADVPRSSSEHPRLLLSAFLDDELDEGTATWVTRHVVACTGCAAELGRLREARNALRGLPDIDLPSAVLAEVATSAQQAGQEGRRSRRRRLASAGIAGALALLLGVAFAMGEPAGEVTPPVEMFVVDHVVQHGGGPMIVPVDLNER